MRSLFIFFLISVLVPTNASDIYGIVKDELGIPIEYASVLLYTMEDSVFVKGTVTATDGGFCVKDVENKKYIINVSVVGYYEYHGVIDTGREACIIMKEKKEELKGIVIKAKHPSAQITNEGLIMPISGSFLEKLGTAEDIIKQIPGVMKNQNGYEVFGKGHPRFYIDEKRVTDLSELNRIASEDIKSVEVLYNPGAKYNATAMSIILIHTKHNRIDGLAIDASSSYHQSENTDLEERLTWNYYKKDMNVYGKYEYSLNNLKYNSMTNTTIDSDTLWQQDIKQNSKTASQRFKIITGLNCFFCSRHSLGAEYELTLSPVGKTEAFLKSDIMANGTPYDKVFNTVSTTNKNHPAHRMDIYYAGEWNKTSVNLDVAYLFNRNRGESLYNEESSYTSDRMVHSSESVRNSLFATKLLVQNKIFGGTLSIGAECTNTYRNNLYNNKEGYVSSSYSEIKESNVAPFSEFSHKLPWGMFVAGIRYEHIVFDYSEEKFRNTKMTKYYDNFFPSFSATIQIGDASFRLGYTMKTNRPTYRQLSANVAYINRFLLQSGNSMLKNEMTNNVFLGCKWKSFNITVDYNETRDAIFFWVEPEDCNTSVSRITYTNIPKLKVLTTSFMTSHRINIWTSQLMIAANKQWLWLDIMGKRKSFNTPIIQLYFNNTIKLSKSLSVITNISIMTKGNSKNMFYEQNSYLVDIYLTKMLLKDRLFLQIKGSDLFYSNTHSPTLNAANVRMCQKNKYDSREFSVLLRYKINTIQNKYKGTRAGMYEKGRL